jgi:hypothetical protein
MTFDRSQAVLPKNPDGTVNVDELSDGTIECMYYAAVGHGNTKAADDYWRLLEERRSPELYRHSRRRQK